MFMLSTSIYDLVLIYVCHFLHHHLQGTFLSNQRLSRYSRLHLGSLHPRIFYKKIQILHSTIKISLIIKCKMLKCNSFCLLMAVVSKPLIGICFFVNGQVYLIYYSPPDCTCTMSRAKQLKVLAFRKG